MYVKKINDLLQTYKEKQVHLKKDILKKVYLYINSFTYKNINQKLYQSLKNYVHMLLYVRC